MVLVVPINKTEKDLLVKAFPPHKYPHYYCYPRTMKQDSKRGHYFCVESPELLAKLNKFDIQGLVMTAVVPYLVFMVIYLGATWVIFNMKYTEGRRKVKKYYNNLKKVNQMYEREERLRTSDHKDWD